MSYNNRISDNVTNATLQKAFIQKLLHSVYIYSNNEERRWENII